MSDIDPAALGARAETMIQTLGSVSADSKRLVRQFLTPEHRRAADMIAGWMREQNLSVSEDALGTVRGRWPAGNGGKKLLIGSHIDTVVDAGMYDGPLGVIAGILAAGHFAKAGRRLGFGIDVLAFGDEEGLRFPATLASSTACAGIFDFSTLELADGDGITLAQAIANYGQNVGDISAAAYLRDTAAAYVEVHIEQGPVLELGHRPLGVVTSIAGQTYLNVQLLGEAGHAGTVPMRQRRDAFAGAAEVTLLAERLAQETEGEVLATIGHVTIPGAASNVIAGNVALIVDIRSGSDAARARFVEHLRAQMRGIAERRQLGLLVTSTRDVATTPCDPTLQEGFATAVTAVGAQPLRLSSGAGHDGTAMAKLCPIGMLFVRCRGGVSHNPLEYASPADLGLAVAALIRFIERFEPF
ncbi:MAG: M20 family metallo-hydrolase [Pseudolabrys sp.]